jgi:hypothetical protein
MFAAELTAGLFSSDRISNRGSLTLLDRHSDSETSAQISCNRRYGFHDPLRAGSQDVGRAAAGLPRGTWAAGEMDAHPSDCRWGGTQSNRSVGRVGRSATTAALTPATSFAPPPRQSLRRRT